MELRELEYFKTVVEEGSVLRASQRLHISQPPLSRMMRQLENELETQLFIRGKRITLTPTGKLLYERACSLLSLTEDTLKEISSMEKKNEITLQLGIVSSSAGLLYSHTLESFCKQYKNVRFNIREANTYQLIELLHHKIIDLAIVRTPFNTAGFQSYFFHREPMTVLSRTSCYPKQIGLSSLSGKPLILYRRFKEIITALFKENALELNIIAEVDDAKTAILLSSTGIGSAVVPQSAYTMFRYLGLSSARLQCEELYTSLGMIYRSNEILSETAQTFIRYLKEKGFIQN